MYLNLDKRIKMFRIKINIWGQRYCLVGNVVALLLAAPYSLMIHVKSDSRAHFGVVQSPNPNNIFTLKYL